MAGKGPSHAPLSYRDHLKIREATKHLHSRFVSVRNAAAKEIQRILARRQQARGRLDPKRWARQAWERVHHGKKHECGNCEYDTRDRAMLRKHQEAHMREAGQAVRSGPAATPGLRERQERAKSPARTPETRRPAPARTPDMRQQAGLLPQDQKRQAASQPPTMGQRLVAEARRQGKHDLAGQMEASGWGTPLTDSQMRDLDRKETLERAGRHEEAAQIGRKIAAERTAAKAERAAPSRPATVTNASLRQEARARRAASRPASPVRPPAAPSAPRTPAAAPKLAPLPHETVRAPSASRGKPRLRMPRLRARA